MRKFLIALAAVIGLAPMFTEEAEAQRFGRGGGIGRVGIGGGIGRVGIGGGIGRVGIGGGIGRVGLWPACWRRWLGASGLGPHRLVGRVSGLAGSARGLVGRTARSRDRSRGPRLWVLLSMGPVLWVR